MKITDVYAEQNAIERMCGVSGVKLTWIDPNDDNQTPRCDLKRKVLSLPKPSLHWSEHERKLNRAYMWHENGHLDASQAGVLPMLEREGICTSSNMGIVLNGLDDVWQEMVTTRRYVGAASDLDYCQGYFCDFGAKMMEQGKSTNEFVYKILALCYSARSEWQPSVAMHVKRYLKFADISAWEHLIPRVNGIIDHPDQEEEMLRIAREMFEADDTAPDPQEGTQDKSEDSDKNGDPDEGDGDEEGESKGGKGEETDEEGEAKGGYVSYKDMMAHSHEAAEKGEPSGIQIIYDHEPAWDYTPAGPDEFRTGYSQHPEIGRYRRPIDKQLVANAGTSASIKRLFQSESQTKRDYLRKRGKITPKHLTRVVQGDPRIFHRKTARIDREADVYLLVDCSGSMIYNDRFAMADAACISLATALESAGIPVKVAGYTNDMYIVEHYTVKDWHEPVNPDTMAHNFACIDLGDNSDGDNLMQAYRELKARNNKRQILIVLSDGSPATFRHGDAYTYLKEVCKQLEQVIELYGIGIETDSVRDYYSNYCVINNASEIESTLCDVVSNYLLEKK